MHRKDHIAWCKKRALEYVDNNDLDNAYASMVSDLGKQDKTINHISIGHGMAIRIKGHLNTRDKMKEFIEEFN